jgi:hypothetical protein
LRDIEAALQVEDRSGHDRGAEPWWTWAPAPPRNFDPWYLMLGGPKFSPDGKYLAVSIEDAVRIWSTADWKMLREVKIKTSHAWAVSPGSHCLLGPRDADEEGNTVSFQVIDTLTNEEVARITANRVRATAFGHDGRNIAIGSYPALELWQIMVTAATPCASPQDQRQMP